MAIGRGGLGSFLIYSDSLALSSVAHELRAPITALAAASEVLERDLQRFDGEQVRLMVRTIHVRALGLNALLDNLMCAGSISGGRFRVTPRATDLSAICVEAASAIEPMLSRRGQALRLPRRALIVNADARRISQVVINLLVNASKFSPEGSTIELSFGSRGRFVRATVADRGRGFEGSARSLFEAYTQGPGTVADRGVGLGLSIVRTIVEAHGGRVGARNRHGGGSRFWFELPAAMPADIEGGPRE